VNRQSFVVNAVRNVLAKVTITAGIISLYILTIMSIALAVDTIEELVGI